MTHVITSLCLRDGACVDVCPVECIVGGKPEDEWPWFFIDPATCIDCGACVPECPYEAIFPEAEVPSAITLKAGQEVQPFRGERYAAAGGESIDLTPDIPWNGAFYTEGPGYGARSM
jgi:NAD-dependent dihydropyrimidine dehydrogenase PreA subunit